MSKNKRTRNGSPLYWSAETWAFMALRLFLSLRLLTAGLGKFQGEGGYSFANLYNNVIPWMVNTFTEQTNLPGFLVVIFAHLLAYVEIGLGLCLLLGVKTKYVLALFGLTFVALAYGQMLLGEGSKVTDIGIHLMMTVAALYFVRHNKLELLR